MGGAPSGRWHDQNTDTRSDVRPRRTRVAECMYTVLCPPRKGPRCACPASSRWQVFGLGEVGDLRVGVAEVDLDWAVPGQVLVGSDGVVLDPVALDVGGQVDRVGDLFEEQPFVLQGAEAAFA